MVGTWLQLSASRNIFLLCEVQHALNRISRALQLHSEIVRNKLPFLLVGASEGKKWLESYYNTYMFLSQDRCFKLKFPSTEHVIEDLHEAVVRGVICSQIVKFAWCLIRTQLWLVETDNKSTIFYRRFISTGIFVILFTSAVVRTYHGLFIILSFHAHL